MGTVHTLSQERGLGPNLEMFARSTTSFLVVIYGLGFLILSVYEAHYGIVQFNPLRARIFLVGFVFATLVALPAAAQHYGLAYFAPLQAVFENTNPSLANHRHAVIGAGFMYTASVIASFFSAILLGPSSTPPSWWRGALAMAGLLIALVVYIFVGKNFMAHPRKAVAGALLATAAFTGCLYLTNRDIANLTVWLFLSGLFTLDMRRSSDRIRFALDFRNWYLVIVSLSIFIFTIFGKVPQWFGGGAPAPVVLYLNKSVASFTAGITSVSLLDENEQGYYVLGGKGRALFIPRNVVDSIYFGSVEDLSKSK